MSVFSRRILLLLCCAAAISIGSGCTKQARKAKLLESANGYFKDEEFGRAESEYLDVLQVPPRSAVATGNLGIMYQMQGKVNQAYHLLTNAVTMDPTNAAVRLKLGQIYLAEHEVQRAHAEALEHLKLEPASEEGLLLLVESTPQADLKSTLHILQNLPANAKGTAAQHLALGAVYVGLTNLENAEVELKQALALNPKSSLSYRELAKVYFLQEDLVKAEEAHKTASALAPLRSQLRVSRAEFQFRAGKTNEACTAMEELVKKAPDYIPARVFLSTKAFETGDTNACTANLDELLKRDPRNYNARLIEGKLLMVKQERTNAFNHFVSMATDYDKSAEVNYLLGLASLAVGDLAKATASLNRSMTSDTNYLDPVLALAELNIGRGNPAVAIESLKPILTRTNSPDPSKLETACLLLISAYARNNQLDQSLAYYSHTVQFLSQANAYLAHMLMGAALKNDREKDRKKDARAAFEDALKIENALKIATNSLPAFTQLVYMDVQATNFQAAESRVKERIDQEPKSATLHYLLASVYSAQASFDSKKNISEKATGVSDAKLRMELPAVRDAVGLAETNLLKSIELEPDQLQSYLDLSRLYVASSRHQLALERLQQVVRRKPDDLATLTLIGMIQDELKHYEEAKTAYERCLEVYPKYALVLNNLACLYSEKFNDLPKAYEMASRVRELQPQNPGVADTLGWVLYRRAEYSRAIALLEESQRGFSNRGLSVPPEIHYHLGMSYYMAGNEKDAVVTFSDFQRSPNSNATDADSDARKVEVKRRLELLAIDPAKADATALALLQSTLKESPGDPIVLTRLAAIQTRDGAPEKALQSYKLVLDRNPKNVRALLGMAVLYAGPLRDPAKALEMAKQARNAAPQDPQAVYTLGKVAFQTRDFEWAASLLQEAARQLPNDPEVSYDLAWSHYSQGRVSQATEAVKFALAGGKAFSRTEDAQQFQKFLELCKAVGEPQKAADEAANALKKNADYVPAIVLSAATQERQTNFLEAAKTYAHVLKAYPQFSPAMRSLARIYFYNLKDDKQSYDFAVKAREALPEDAEVAKVLGILCYRRDDYSRSSQLLQKSAGTLTKDGEVQYYLGMAYWNLNQKKEAANTLETALALNLPQDLATSAREELSRLKKASSSK